MKNILTINTANAGGGAEKVAYSLCKELHLRGYNSKMLARKIDYGADPLARQLVVPVPGDDLVYSAGNFLDELFSTQYLFYLPTWKIPLMDITQDADVIHLHNMHGYYFNLSTIPFLMWQKPVVWTFHDMWPFTGKCSHSYECDRFTSHCGQCPYLHDYPKLIRDTTRIHLFLKKIFFAKRKFIIVSPSEWLCSKIRQSVVRDIPCEIIPSPVDTKIFYPESTRLARERLGIPQDKKVVLFIASWVNSIPSKGLTDFKEMLKALYVQRDDVFTLIVGHLEGQSVLKGQFTGKETGWINDPAMTRSCYSAADLLVSPTMAENSSCTIVEAMACGTPTVAYNSGGVPEQIVHNETGYLIQRGDQKSLVNAVQWLLGDDETRTRMHYCASERARNQYSMELCVEKYLHAYQEAIRYH